MAFFLLFINLLRMHRLSKRGEFSWRRILGHEAVGGLNSSSIYNHPVEKLNLTASKTLTDTRSHEFAESNRLIADDTLISYEDYRHHRRSHFFWGSTMFTRSEFWNSSYSSLDGTKYRDYVLLGESARVTWGHVPPSLRKRSSNKQVDES
jgi:hypothetical protein